MKVRSKHRAFSQGEAADDVFYIQKGQVKLTVVSKQGKEATYRAFGRWRFRRGGIDCFLSSHPPDERHRDGGVRGAQNRTRADDTNASTSNPDLSSTFTTFLLARNARIQEDLVDQLFNSSEKRLARALLITRSIRQARKTRDDYSQSRSRDFGADDWHYAITNQLLHEPIPQDGLH